MLYCAYITGSVSDTLTKSARTGSLRKGASIGTAKSEIIWGIGACLTISPARPLLRAEFVLARRRTSPVCTSLFGDIVGKTYVATFIGFSCLSLKLNGQ